MYEIAWQPIIWIISFVVIAIVAYIIRASGKADYKGGEQEKPFLSGNEAPKEEMHIGGSNIYWGFLHSLEGYYNSMKKMHSGIINDYVSWFVLITAIIFISLFLMEVIK
ncbi:MAG: hydrogenase [Thermoplasmatales archaeon]|nr:hydrogenase [Thermoplasmatales archaeon]